MREASVKYLLEEGILTERDIKRMTEASGGNSVVECAMKHGWRANSSERKKREVVTDPRAVASIDVELLTRLPNPREVDAVWESIPKGYSADGFEFIGDEKDLGAGIVGQNFSHYSEGLKIYGYLYKPSCDGPFPLLILNHSGFGIGKMYSSSAHAGANGVDSRPFSQWCYELAKEGYVVMASGYRGAQTDAGQSDGEFEGGRGEVTDILNLVACGKTLPCVESKKIGMMGTSHGGWITAMAIQRTRDIGAAISFFPPANLFFSASAPLGGSRARVEGIMKGELLVGGAVGTVDLAVFRPLVLGRASAVKTREEMIARTAYLFAKHTNTPLYIICGGEDPLLPDSEQLYLALLAHGKKTCIKIYPGEKHGFNYRGSLNAIDDSFQETVKFFDNLLKSEKLISEESRARKKENPWPCR